MVAMVATCWLALRWIVLEGLYAVSDEGAAFCEEGRGVFSTRSCCVVVQSENRFMHLYHALIVDRFAPRPTGYASALALNVLL